MLGQIEIFDSEGKFYYPKCLQWFLFRNLLDNIEKLSRYTFFIRADSRFYGDLGVGLI